MDDGHVANEVLTSRPYQLHGYNMLRELDYAWLGWDMGTGKTKPVVDYIRNEQPQRVAILCPPSVVHVWAAEFAKHAPGIYANIDEGPTDKTLGYLAPMLAPKSVAARCKIALRIRNRAYGRDAQFILIVNYQAIRSKPMQELLLGVGSSWSLVVCDESHKIKSPNGVTSKLIGELSRRAFKRICLTGTPLPHSPLDAFGQCRFLDPSVFGRSYVRFRATYPFTHHVRLGVYGDADKLTVGGEYTLVKLLDKSDIRGKYWNGTEYVVPANLTSANAICETFKRDQWNNHIPVRMSDGFKRACDFMGCTTYKSLTQIDLADTEKRFAAKLAPFFHRVKLEDVLDLPPVTDRDIIVELSPKAATVYRAMHSSLSAGVKDGTVTAANALVKILRLQQITSGSVPVSRDDLWSADTKMEEVDTSKKEALSDYLEALPADEPVVVFARFKADLDAAVAAAHTNGREVVQIRGGINEIGAVWKDGPATVAVVQVQAGGVGIDLTRARYAVFYSLSFDMAEYLQCRARLHRSGQQRTVHISHLVARGTIDEQLYAALEEREINVGRILKAMADGNNA